MRSNCKPITLLSCLGKVFTSILNNRISKYLEENRLLSEMQAGFRKQYSTIDNIFTLHALLEICKSRKLKLYCCFVDYTKAFDNVWRVGLWQKLLKQCFQGKIFHVIKKKTNKGNKRDLIVNRLLCLVVWVKCLLVF